MSKAKTTILLALISAVSAVLGIYIQARASILTTREISTSRDSIRNLNDSLKKTAVVIDTLRIRLATRQHWMHLSGVDFLDTGAQQYRVTADIDGTPFSFPADTPFAEVEEEWNDSIPLPVGVAHHQITFRIHYRVAGGPLQTAVSDEVATIPRAPFTGKSLVRLMKSGGVSGNMVAQIRYRISAHPIADSGERTD